MHVTASQIALITADAASFDRAGSTLWVELVKVCVAAGWTLPQVVAFMKSRHIRHFLDSQNLSAPASRIAREFDRLVMSQNLNQRQQLVEQTFGWEA